MRKGDPELKQPPRGGESQGVSPGAVRAVGGCLSSVLGSKQALCLLRLPRSPPPSPLHSPGDPPSPTIPSALLPSPRQGVHAGIWGTMGHPSTQQRARGGCRCGWAQMWMHGLVLPDVLPPGGRGDSTHPQEPGRGWQGAGGGVRQHAQLPAFLPAPISQPHACSPQLQTQMPPTLFPRPPQASCSHPLNPA